MKHWCITAALIAILPLITLTEVASSEDPASDPILDYYCQKARTSYDLLSPARNTIRYSIAAVTYYKNIGRNGLIKDVDSITGWYHYSSGKLDSSSIIPVDKEFPGPVDFSYPDVFEGSYRFSFYPNDTGGEEIAIGFERRVEPDSISDGVVIMARETGRLKWLFAYTPSKQGYNRYSRAIRFAEFDGLLLPDSMWVVAAKSGILSTDFYRLETRVDSVRVYR